MYTGHDLRGLYAIIDSALIPDERILTVAESAIRGGASLLQYRDKTSDTASRERQARALSQLCLAHGIPLIINDDVGLAGAISAAGVHVGRDDMDPIEARVQLGPHAIIGVSCYASLERALDAARAGADYVAFGSFFPSPTKPGADTAPLSLLVEAREKLDLPICAIGGITPDNGGLLVQEGASLLAVISGLFGHKNTEAAAHRYSKLFK